MQVLDKSGLEAVAKQIKKKRSYKPTGQAHRNRNIWKNRYKHGALRYINQVDQHSKPYIAIGIRPQLNTNKICQRYAIIPENGSSIRYNLVQPLSVYWMGERWNSSPLNLAGSHIKYSLRSSNTGQVHRRIRQTIKKLFAAVDQPSQLRQIQAEFIQYIRKQTPFSKSCQSTKYRVGHGQAYMIRDKKHPDLILHSIIFHTDAKDITNCHIDLTFVRKRV